MSPSTTPVEIPWTELSEDALNGVLESFVLREGTDYGAVEIGLETKINQVKRQLSRGDIKIVFDPESESIQILTAHEFRKRQKASPTQREATTSSRRPRPQA